jgi:hypothetical protein
MSQPLDLNQLAQNIKQWGAELGFQKVGHQWPEVGFWSLLLSGSVYR